MIPKQFTSFFELLAKNQYEQVTSMIANEYPGLSIIKLDALQIYKTQMGFLKGVKNFIYKADFFYTAELLRYREEPQYRTLMGGIMSLTLIIALLITFYNKVLDTLNMVIITASTSSTNARDPTPFTIQTLPSGPFMMGVEIWHFNLNEGYRYFDIVLSNTVYATGQAQDTSVQYALQPCTKEHWEGYPQIQNSYERLHINYWQCLPRNAQFEIKGKYASIQSKTLDVSVRPCTNNSFDDRPCANQSQIDTFMSDNGNFFFTIYFLNPLINPESQNYLTHYLQDSNYIIFSSTGGQQAQILMQDYTINTDQSILPFTAIKQETGALVAKNAIKNRYEVGPNYDTYCTFFIFKSSNSISMDRSFQKIDEILSYIGGLFGTIAICLFLVNVYNSYSFQITIGSYLYKTEGETNKYRRYNFLHFLAQMVYGLLSIFNYSPNWQTIKCYYECRQEMVRQLDILYLLKRVTYLERATEMLFDDSQLKGMQMLRQISLEEAKHNRKKYKLRQKMLFQSIKQQKNDSGGKKQIMVMQNGRVIQNGNNASNNSMQQLNLVKVGSSNNVFNFNFNQESFGSKTLERKRDIQKLKKHIQNHYSSDSSEDDEQDRNYKNILPTLYQLNCSKERDQVNNKIWDKMDSDIKEYALYHQDDSTKIQEQNFQFLTLSPKESPKHHNQSKEQISQIKLDRHSRQLPKLRQHPSKILMNPTLKLNPASSIMTQQLQVNNNVQLNEQLQENNRYQQQ